MRQAGTVAVVGVLMLGMVTSTARTAEAFAPPVLVPPVLAPIVTGGAGMLGVSGAVTGGGAAAAGAISCPVTCPIVIGAAAGAAVAYLGWRVWESQGWEWPDGDPAEAELAAGVASDGSWVGQTHGPDGPYDGSVQSLEVVDVGCCADTWKLVYTLNSNTYQTPTKHTLTLQNGTVSSNSKTSVVGTNEQLFHWQTPGVPAQKVRLTHNGFGHTGRWTEYGFEPGSSSGEPIKARLKSTATFMDANGNTSTDTQTSPWYTDGEDPLPMLPGHAGSELERIVDLEVVRETEEPTVVPNETMVEWEVPQEHLDPAHQYADCLKGQGCTLHLKKLLANGQLVDCNMADSPCVGWAQSLNRDTEYECHWGPYLMTLNQCAALDHPYRAPTGAPTTTITETEPTLEEPTQTEQEGFWTRMFTKLFVPTTAPEQAAAIGETIGEKTPFVQLRSAMDWVGGMTDPGTACWKIAVVVEGEEYGPLDCSGLLYDWLQEKRTLLAIVLYGMFLIPLLWWAWRTYAPGTTSAA